jgi:hypothetical protein
VDDETLARLRVLADEAEARSERWSESTDEVAVSAYARLRAEACALAQSHGLAVGDEFEAIAPTVAGLPTLRALEPYRAGMALPAAESVSAAPVQRALRGLAAWAIGVRMGGELRL